MKIRISLFALLCLLYNGQSLAQEEAEPPSSTIAKFILGYGHFPNSDLKAFTPQLQEPAGNHFYFGVANGGMSDKLVIFFNAMFSGGGSAAIDSMESKYSGYAVNMELGYPLVKKEGFRIYPLLGTGFSLYNIFIDEKADLSLWQVQQNFGRSINLNRAGLSLDFSLNIDLTPNWKYSEKAESYNSFLYGLKLGYHYQFAGNNWKHNGGEITGAPEFGMQGFYLGLSLGFISTNQL